VSWTATGGRAASLCRAVTGVDRKALRILWRAASCCSCRVVSRFLQAAGIKRTKTISQSAHNQRDTAFDHDEPSRGDYYEQLQSEITTHADIARHREKVTNDRIMKIFHLLDRNHNLTQQLLND
jgi:hypothetical protein